MTDPVPGGQLGSASEAAIAALAIGGDDEAYGELVRRRQGSLRNMLRRLTRDAALADDICQQAFVHGWRSIRSLKSPMAFGAWLRTLAINAWLAHLRSRRREILAEEPLQDDPARASAGEETAAGVAMDLDAALERLPADARVCIVLAYAEGMSHGEISEATGFPLGTVKSHIARGAARLREILHAYGDRHVERI